MKKKTMTIVADTDGKRYAMNRPARHYFEKIGAGAFAAKGSPLRRGPAGADGKATYTMEGEAYIPQYDSPVARKAAAARY